MKTGPTGVGTDSMLMQTIGNLDLNAVLGRAGAAESQGSPDSSVASEISQDPVVAAMADLRSGDRRRVRHRLKTRSGFGSCGPSYLAPRVGFGV